MPARAATSPELSLLRTQPQWSKARAAIFHPTTIYTARINQVFASYDGVLEITYDAGVGTLADVLPDMTVFVGSTAGAWDIGICRLRSIDVSKFYIDQKSDVKFANDQYLTVVNDFGIWARHVLISAGVPYMDGGIAYSDQHTNMDPVVIMGGDRVLKLTGSTISTTYDWSLCYMPDGSAIATYATSSPTASGGSDLDTDSPTLEWDGVGWHEVYLTLTGVNGKSFFGVRYVYIWNEANQPAHAEIGENGQDVDSGGWSLSLTLYDNCDLNDVHDHALVIVFTEDRYGSNAQSIGPLAGCENILFEGWIAKEQIDLNPEQGLVEFTAYSAQYWLQKIPGYPTGVTFTAAAPTAWTQMQNLTVDLGLWHLLHWRTTITRVMDVFLSGDTKYTKETSSLAKTIWEQIREISFNQIFARPGVNEYKQLYIQVHPNLIPEADRSSIPVVMDIEKRDMDKHLRLERVTVPEVAVVYGRGVAVNSLGAGTPYFSLAPGHTYPHYGSIEMPSDLLVESQSQANTLFGLYRSWKNNELPNIPIPLKSNNRLIGCYPNQYCTLTIDAADSPRGVAYEINLIPTSKTYVVNPKSGKISTELTFEAETFEGLCVDGDVPGSGDVSVPPTPSFPSPPPFPVLIPGGLPPGPEGGPERVLFLDTNKGLILATGFNTSNPVYTPVNNGISDIPFPTGTGGLVGVPRYKMIQYFYVTPSGAVYIWRPAVTSSEHWNDGSAYFMLARAPSVGAPFVILFDNFTVSAEGNEPAPGEFGAGLIAAGFNSGLPDSFAFTERRTPGGTSPFKVFRLGSGGSFSDGAIGVMDSGFGSTTGTGLSYGYGRWLNVGYNRYELISADGATILETHLNANGAGSPPTFTGADDSYTRFPARVSTSGKLYLRATNAPTTLCTADNNLLTSLSFIGDSNFRMLGFDCDPTGQYMMSYYTVGQRGKSGDYGNTWATMGSLPLGSYHFCYAGQSAALPRFIAFKSTVRLTLDFGTTWITKENTSLTDIAPVPNLVAAQVLE